MNVSYVKMYLAVALRMLGQIEGNKDTDPRQRLNSHHHNPNPLIFWYYFVFLAQISFKAFLWTVIVGHQFVALILGFCFYHLGSNLFAIYIPCLHCVCTVGAWLYSSFPIVVECFTTPVFFFIKFGLQVAHDPFWVVIHCFAEASQTSKWGVVHCHTTAVHAHKDWASGYTQHTW